MKVVYLECPPSTFRNFAKILIEILLSYLKNLDLFYCVAYSGTPKDIGTFKRDAYWHLQNLNRSEIIVQSLPYSFLLLCIKNNMERDFERQANKTTLQTAQDVTSIPRSPAKFALIPASHWDTVLYMYQQRNVQKISDLCNMHQTTPRHRLDLYMYLSITFQYKQQDSKDSYIILKHIQLWHIDDLFKKTTKFCP